MTAGNAVTIDVSVLGDEALTRIFTNIDKKLATRALGPALSYGMRKVKAQAEATAPRLTTRMATTLRVKRGNRRGRVTARVQTARRDQLGIPADAKYYYPAAQELGTEDMEAKRFLRNALESESAAVFEEVRTHLWRRVRALGLGQDPGEGP